MTDKDLVEAVRNAANSLCDALNAAGEARLQIIECSVMSNMSRSFPDGTVARTDWKPLVRICRTISL